MFSIVLIIISILFFSWIGLVIGDIEILSYLEFGLLVTISIVYLVKTVSKKQ